MVVDQKDCPLAAIPLFEIESRQLRILHRRAVISGFEFPAHPLIATSLTARQGQELLAYLLRAVESAADACNADELRISYPAVIGGVTAIAKYHYCPLRHFGFSDDSGVGWILNLRQDIGELERGLDKSCRNMIRRAQKEGCSVRPISDRGEWMRCFEVAKETLGVCAPSEHLHGAYWDWFIAPGYAKTNAVIPPAAQKPSNIVVCAAWNMHSYYWKSFNSRCMRIPGANNLALWEAIASARQSGAAAFELGSLEFDDPKQQAIAAFKGSFGGTPTGLLRGVRYRRPIKHAAAGLLSAVYHSSFKS